MMKFKLIQRNYLGLLLVIYILSGCSNGLDNLTISKTANIGKPNNTVSPTQANSTPNKYATQSPIATEIKLTLTPTIIPTYTSEQREILIQNLLVTNGVCLLPCWWGMTPGITKWSEANQFLDSFSRVEGPVKYEEDGVQKIGYQINFEVDDLDMAFGISIDEGVISDFGVSPEISVNKYKLNQLLSRLQQPEEVWLAPMPATPGGPWFYLVLYYPDKGILARYGGEASLLIKTDKDGKAIITGINVCPVGMGPELWLKSPNKRRGVISNPALGGTEFTNLLKRIDDVTDMSIDDFFNLFRNADDTTCFDVRQ